ncbi:MAG TPA: hypothetical protein VLW50_01705 [Streptosporangiaceae bacterium]|nr:hypothetical protein [Streptosporangiaceae bacterium]
MSPLKNPTRVQFKVYAATDAECGGLDYVKATTHRTVTPEEARAIAAQFPKSVGLRAHRFIGRSRGPETGEVMLHADLCPQTPNRPWFDLYPHRWNYGVNKGGVKRYRSFRMQADRLGHEVHYDAGQFQGSPDVVSSEEDFENRLCALLLLPPEYGVRKLWNPQESPAWPRSHRSEWFEL